MSEAARVRKVTMIPQRIQPLMQLPLQAMVKRKVAGYARVSTDSEEQENSYEAQVDYFTDYIKQREDWEFVKVYTEEEHSYPVLFQTNIARHYTNDEQKHATSRAFSHSMLQNV